MQRQQCHRGITGAEAAVLQRHHWCRGSSVTETALLQRQQCYRGSSVTETALLQRQQCCRGSSVAKAPVLQRQQCCRRNSSSIVAYIYAENNLTQPAMLLVIEQCSRPAMLQPSNMAAACKEDVSLIIDS